MFTFYPVHTLSLLPKKSHVLLRNNFQQKLSLLLLRDYSTLDIAHRVKVYTDIQPSERNIIQIANFYRSAEQKRNLIIKYKDFIYIEAIQKESIQQSYLF